MRIVQNGKQLPTEKNDDLQNYTAYCGSKSFSTASSEHSIPTLPWAMWHSLLLFSIQMAAQLWFWCVYFICPHAAIMYSLGIRPFSTYFHLQFSSVAQSSPTLCDPMNRSTPGLPVHHQLPEFTQTHVHWVSDTIQPSHPLSSPSPPAPNPSQHQSLFQWVNSSHEVAQVLEFQL